MSMLDSKFSLCVLELPEEFKMTQGEAFNALKGNLFVDLTPTQDFGHGWVFINDMFRTDFTMEDSIAVNSVVGGYRYDKKSVPGALLKKLFREKLKEREKEEGRKFEKADKDLLKEECKQLLLPKVLANPKLVTWIWDMDNHRVYLDAKSMAIVEKFIMLFINTFKVPKVIVKDYSLDDDQRGTFLDWIWKNTTNIKDTWIDNGVTLDATGNTFQFKGPTLDTFLEEIESFKNGKSIKSLNIGCSINKLDYSITLNDKNLIVGIECSDKIEHESFETAILDNTDRISAVICKIQETVNQFNT